ncbi:unnamed protein product [Bursaphelenchus xylophilus]|nr:unnamed protein product [Bursaphelenchus xylophilus]CAG9109292.1 unnamed protein product [Bursaphelenchus xylophilus]
MVNSCFNTLYILQREGGITNEDTNLFRCRLALKLATPPPALLIGVPDEKTSSATVPPTPIGSTSPAIILPNTLHSLERHPLPIVLFCGASLESLDELKEYIECGTPAVIVEDSSELCAVLRNCFMLYNTPNFEHKAFLKWLHSELHSIELDVDQIAKAKDAICSIFATGIGPRNLFSFIKAVELENLPEHLLQLLSKTANDLNDLTQVAQLAAKLNVVSIIKQLEVGKTFSGEAFHQILLHALTSSNNIDTLTEILNQRPPIVLPRPFLLDWLDNIDDKYFFESVILESTLGYLSVPTEINSEFVNDINKLLYELSDGVFNLFPSEILLSPPNEVDTHRTLQVMALWAVLSNQLEVCKCLAAHSNEPLSLAIILARISKSLVEKCGHLTFYRQGYEKAQKYFEEVAVGVVSSSFNARPLKTYESICTQNRHFNGQSPAVLAFETENRSLLANDCFKCWAQRLVNSTLSLSSESLTNLCGFKIILSALFVFPIRNFFIQRHPLWNLVQRGYEDKGYSPTVAMLEFEGRTSKPRRALSMYSATSRSICAHDFLNTRETTPLDLNPDSNELGTFNMDFNDSQSTNFMHTNHTLLPGNEDAESFLYGHENRTRHTPSPMGVNLRWSPSYQARKVQNTTFDDVEAFYNTPLVKLWISLFFRIFYLVFFAAMLIGKGCANETALLLVWIWTLSYLCEGFWVLTIRLKTTGLNKMKFHLLDQLIIMTFLFGSLLFRMIGAKFWSENYPNYWYVHKSLQAAFFVYQCYSTFFIYGIYFDSTGKLIIRLKNVITQNVSGILLLTVLAFISTVIATKTIVYPDTDGNSAKLLDSIDWAVKSFINTDLSLLSESSECAKFAFTQPPQQCGIIGGYGNRNCPTQGFLSNIVVLQYLMVLKLVFAPLFIALVVYAVLRTDDSFDYQRTLQLYSTGREFSARPVLPPPFTFFFFGILILKRFCGCGMWIRHVQKMSEHPDERGLHGVFGKHQAVYRNPSIPPMRRSKRPDFWTQKFIDSWHNRKLNSSSESTTIAVPEAVRRLNEKLQLLVISSVFKETSDDKNAKHWRTEGSTVIIDDEYKAWTTLLPDYYPPYSCKSVEEFPAEIRRRVDNIDNIVEIAKHWRQSKLSRHINEDASKMWLLSADGLPLNPLGRRGKSGRGDFVKFGPNVIYFYVILVQLAAGVKVLLTSKNELPNKRKYGGLRSDEYLSEILTELKVADSEIQRFSIRSHLNVGQRDHNIAHVICTPLDTNDATDNAWTEADVWATLLTNYTPHQSSKYHWFDVNDGEVPNLCREFVQKSVDILKTSL